MTSTLRKSPFFDLSGSQKVYERVNFPQFRRLASGLTIIAEQLPVEAVNLSLWLNVGSAVESDEINGMAHFLEHMIFKGTERLAAGEFERRIEERGAVTNAATSQDYTHFYLTSAPQDFAVLAPLQFDVVFNPQIPDQAFERERGVVLEEIRRSQDNPRRRTFYRSMELAFDVLPYRRPVLGPVEVIENLIPQQMRDFHQGFYVPSNMTAVAVGNLPVEELLDIVEDSFTQSVQQKDGAEVFDLLAEGYLPESAFEEVVRREYVDESLQQARLVMVWRVPGIAELEQTYALDVLANILSGGRTSRLIQDLRESRGLVSQVGATNLTHRHQGIFYISAQLPVENLAVVEEIIVSHIRKMQEDFVTVGEMSRVRTQVANRFVFGNEAPSDRAGLYGYYQSMVGDLGPALNYPGHIQALDVVDLQAAAKRYLSAKAYGVIVQRPK